jgi:hypothetical protein
MATVTQNKLLRRISDHTPQMGFPGSNLTRLKMLRIFPFLLKKCRAGKRSASRLQKPYFA